MSTLTAAGLPPEVEASRARLAENLLDAGAARELRQAVAAESQGGPSLAALAQVCDVLDGGGAWNSNPPVPRGLPLLDHCMHELLVLHPREKQERRHELASRLGRLLHSVEGNETAHIVARLTEKARVQEYPLFCRVTAECARALEVPVPETHVARGQALMFTVLADESAFLCVHHDFIDHSSGSAVSPLRLSEPETRFAVGHQLEHIRGGHTALLQLVPELLEGLLLGQLPFFVRRPLKLATKAMGRGPVRGALERAGTSLPEDSRARRVVRSMASLLPEKDQETLLPESLHEWVRGWIHGVELSADRAGLLLCGSVAAACSVMLRLSPHSGPRIPDVLQRGARQLLQEQPADDHATCDRLRELLGFALSRGYLRFVAQSRAA